MSLVSEPLFDTMGPASAGEFSALIELLFVRALPLVTKYVLTYCAIVLSYRLP